MDIPLSPCVPENLVSRDGFSRPVPRQPAHLHTQAEVSWYFVGCLGQARKRCSNRCCCGLRNYPSDVRPTDPFLAAGVESPGQTLAIGVVFFTTSTRDSFLFIYFIFLPVLVFLYSFFGAMGSTSFLRFSSPNLLLVFLNLLFLGTTCIIFFSQVLDFLDFLWVFLLFLSLFFFTSDFLRRKTKMGVKKGRF